MTIKKSKFDSNFPREEYDFYRTFDGKCHHVLAENFRTKNKTITYVEPCVGIGDLVDGLKPYGFKCVYSCDIFQRNDTPTDAVIKNALDLTEEDCSGADYIITNPPWKRKILHEMIEHFVSLRPTWLLFDSDWANTKQASKLINQYCQKISVIGRVQWIEGSKHGSLKDCSWYLFTKNKLGETTFAPRMI